MDITAATQGMFAGFNWFVTQAFHGLLPWPNSFAFVIPLIIMAAPYLLHYFVPNRIDLSDARIRKRLALLPVVWILVALYGYFFRYQGPGHHPMLIMSDILLIPLIAYIIYGLNLFANNDIGRRAIVAFVMVNFYFLISMQSLAYMMISGNFTALESG